MDFDKNFYSGIKDIDFQHLKICNTVNKFSFQNKTEETLLEILFEIQRYIEKHFSTEEMYMEKFHYPEIEKHREAHMLLTKRFEKFTKEIQETGLNERATQELQNYFCKWFVDHYHSLDFPMITFLKTRLNQITENN